MSPRQLRQALLDEYGHLDIKRIDSDNVFVIDDRKKLAGWRLPPWLCHMFIEIKEGGALRVMLGGNVPNSETVSDWAIRWKADFAGLSGLSFLVHQSDKGKLIELADAVEGVGGSSDAWYRTAESLHRLFETLVTVWGG